MTTTYCGKNRNMLGPTVIQGTNYGCLRRGIGGGLHHRPINPDYLVPYSPLYDLPNLWCGISPTVPPGYDAMGTPPQCLTKGWGIGMTMAAEQQADTPTAASRQGRSKNVKSRRRKSQKSKTKRRSKSRRKSKRRSKSRRKSKQRSRSRRNSKQR